MARSWQSSYILKIFATIREVKRYRARYYDPSTQRFLSQDPIGFASGDFNFYRYVGNSPLSNTDPFGKSGIGVGAGIHIVLIGFNGHAITDGTTTSITVCGRFGPGLFAGFGTEATKDLPSDGSTCSAGNHNASVGVGGDVGLGAAEFGASVSMGTAATSATVSGGLGSSVGFSVGVEACYSYSF